jgi:hypothetical protein
MSSRPGSSGGGFPAGGAASSSGGGTARGAAPVGAAAPGSSGGSGGGAAGGWRRALARAAAAPASSGGGAGSSNIYDGDWAEAAGAGAAGSAAEASFKTRENPYLEKFTKTPSSAPLSLAKSKGISTGDDLIDDFDRKIDIVYGDFEEKSANLTAMIELFIEDLKEGKKSIKDLSEKEKREIQKRINLQEEGIARIKVGFSPVKIGTNGLKILGGRRKTKKSRTRKTRKRNT